MSNDHRTPEEKFFHEKEARLRKRLREEFERKMAEQHDKRKIGEGLGTDDESVIDRVHALGLDGEVAHVLHLLPLVEVAWADGQIQAQERESIMAAVEAHGIEPDNPAALFIASLLEQRPSDELLDGVLDILHDILDARDLHPNSLLEACDGVAQASGGIFGFGNKVGAEEREVIRKLTDRIRSDQAKKITDRLE